MDRKKLYLIIGGVVLLVVLGIVYEVLALQKTTTQTQSQEIFVDPTRGQRQITAYVGDRIYTYVPEKPSIGEKLEEPTYDATMLRLYNTRVEDKGNGMPGGDQLNHYYYFEILKAGTVTVQARKVFASRNDSMSVLLFTVTTVPQQ